MRSVRPFFVGGLALAALLGPRPAAADQLQCNAQAVAESATQLLPAGSLLVDFCSLCEAKVLVVKVEAVEVVKDCDFEVQVTGTLVAESQQTFSDGFEPGKASFVPAKAGYKQRLDLAYAYVEVAENDFRWLGGQLGLQATLNTASIQLPGATYRALGPHPRPETAAPVETAAPAPSTAEVQRAFAYFRTGDAPVLGHLIPCRKIDMSKRSTRRYECVEPVRGSVTPGTKVFAWTDWLVPRGVEAKANIEVHKDGKRRLSKPVTLKGRASSPVVPATAALVLSEEGLYEMRVVQDGRQLAEISVEVRK